MENPTKICPGCDTEADSLVCPACKMLMEDKCEECGQAMSNCICKKQENDS